MSLDFYINPAALGDVAYPPAHLTTLGPDGARAALDEIASWPGYSRTPLVALPGLAARVGVASIHYKDESTRFGLGSFKALGGAYAVYRLLAGALERETGHGPITAAALASGEHRAMTSAMTVCSATDGNHGRSVAWGARTFGCRCVIYIHETVSEAREQAIAAYGAEVVRHPGNYDAAVARAAEDAAANGWTVVSDTSWPGYETIPKDVMHGYTVMADEALTALDEAPTHVFLQGGVGGMAAAVLARLWWSTGARRPRTVVVEPVNAACLYESARAGALTTVGGALETIMAGLSCGEPSKIVWPVLADGVHLFATVDDASAADAMCILASGVEHDPPVVAGESAVAGLAGLIAMGANPDARRAAGLDELSRVLVFGTEGDTDPDLYRRIVGEPGDAVRERAAA